MKLPPQLLGFLRNKLATDIGWTLGGFAILALSGVVINIAVTLLRDTASLGIFNQAYATYIVASQFAVLGIHYSVLRHAAYHEDDQSTRDRLLVTAIVMTGVLGLIAGGLLALAAPMIGRLLDSAPSADAMRIAAFGLVLFPLNKVLIAYVNGLRRMKAFAILQSVRYLTVMIVVIGISLTDLPFAFAAFSFLAAETIVALASLAYLWKQGLLHVRGFDSSWFKTHLTFGTKSMMAGMFGELNARLDVLMVGVFMSDQAVGLYSFAAMLADGLFHVLTMIRTNFNPLLVAAARDNQWEQPMSLMQKSRKFLTPITGALALGLIMAFYFIAIYVVPSKGLLEAMPAAIILMLGLTLIARFIPFDNVLLASGHPAYQAGQQASIVVANLLAGIMLIPILGLAGAAASTVIGYVAGIIVLVLMARRLIGWNLVFNRMAA